MPKPPKPRRNGSRPRGARRINPAANPVIVISLGIRPDVASHQAAVQTKRTMTAPAAAWVMPTGSGSVGSRRREIAIRYAEDLLDRNSHTLNQDHDADHDQPEQQGVLGKALSRLILPKILCERHHTVRPPRLLGLYLRTSVLNIDRPPVGRIRAAQPREHLCVEAVLMLREFVRHTDIARNHGARQ